VGRFVARPSILTMAVMSDLADSALMRRFGAPAGRRVVGIAADLAVFIACFGRLAVAGALKREPLPPILAASVCSPRRRAAGAVTRPPQ
jgi:hypothetical protein